MSKSSYKKALLDPERRILEENIIRDKKVVEHIKVEEDLSTKKNKKKGKVRHYKPLIEKPFEGLSSYLS